jgi:hypothetical protein
MPIPTRARTFALGGYVTGQGGGRPARHRHRPVLAFRSGVAGPCIRVAHDHCRAEGPLPDPPELGSVRLRGRGPGRRSALGHHGGRLQPLVLAVVGWRRLALRCSRGAPAAAFASKLARRGGSSAHRAGAPAAGWRFLRPETTARRTQDRLCRRNGGNKSPAACTRVSLFRSHGRRAAQARVLVCDL